MANLDNVQFVCPDAPEEDFIPAGLCVEIPFPVALHDWNGKGPLFVSDIEDGEVWILRLNHGRILFARLGGKSDSPVLVLDRILRGRQILAAWTQNAGESRHVESFGCL